MLSTYQSIYWTTPVDNLFIEEFMGAAPGEFVKVYLYGLRYALYPPEGGELSCADFAKALHAEKEVVVNAFSYWDRAGLVRLESQEPLKVEYLPVEQVFQNRAEHRELYRYRELNQNLQAVVGARRLLTHEDFRLVYQWVEELGMEADAIPLLVEYMMTSRHNPKLSFAYMDKVIRDLALEKKITTLRQTEEYIQGEVACRPAREVLALWNIHRNATVVEGKMWLDWTEGLGFEQPGILLAAGSVAHIASPNFRYLDKVLHTLHDQGIVKTADIRRYLQRSSDVSDRVTPVLRKLGCRGAVTEEMKRLGQSWYDLGFTQAALEKLAASLAREGRSRPDDLDTLARRRAAEGATSEEAVDAFLAEIAEARAAFEELLAAWGENRAPSARERRAWSRWHSGEGHSPEMIALAAEYAQAATDRLSYMNAILARWKEEGLATPEAARASYGRARGAKPEKLAFEKDADAYTHYFDDEEDPFQ